MEVSRLRSGRLSNNKKTTHSMQHEHGECYQRAAQNVVEEHKSCVTERIASCKRPDRPRSSVGVMADMAAGERAIEACFGPKIQHPENGSSNRAAQMPQCMFAFLFCCKRKCDMCGVELQLVSVIYPRSLQSGDVTETALRQVSICVMVSATFPPRGDAIEQQRHGPVSK